MISSQCSSAGAVGAAVAENRQLVYALMLYTVQAGAEWVESRLLENDLEVLADSS